MINKLRSRLTNFENWIGALGILGGSFLAFVTGAYDELPPEIGNFAALMALWGFGCIGVQAVMLLLWRYARKIRKKVPAGV